MAKGRQVGLRFSELEMKLLQEEASIHNCSITDLIRASLRRCVDWRSGQIAGPDWRDLLKRAEFLRRQTYQVDRRMMREEIISRPGDPSMKKDQINELDRLDERDHVLAALESAPLGELTKDERNALASAMPEINSEWRSHKKLLSVLDARIKKGESK